MAARKVGSPRCHFRGGPGLRSRNARAVDTTRFHTNEGVDMTKRTRMTGRSDSGTSASTVKITPVSVRGPVTSTHTVA